MHKRYKNTLPFKVKQTKLWKDIYAGLKFVLSSCFQTPAMYGSKILSMCFFFVFLLIDIILFAKIDLLSITTE